VNKDENNKDEHLVHIDDILSYTWHGTH